MKWTPELNEDEERELRQGWISDNTAFMRWSTEIEEKENITDKRFLKEHNDIIRQIEKFNPLSFYSDKRELKLRKCYLLNTVLAKNAGLDDVAEETSLFSIDVAQTSRGWHGNYSKALITQRHEFKEDKEEKTLGRFSNLFKKKNAEEQQQAVEQ